MNRQTFLVALLTFVAGVGIGYWQFQGNGPKVGEVNKEEPMFYRNPMNPDITSPEPVKDSMGMDYIPVYADKNKNTAERKVLFYRSPMNPSVTSPIPAKDSMGMDYVPVYADSEDNRIAGTVTIDPVVVQNIGVRTELAQEISMSRKVRAVGRVGFDEQRIVRLHPKVEGWVEGIEVDRTGEMVKKDQILLSIYSPKLVSAQQEYLLALNNLSTLEKSPFVEIRDGARELAQSSRERLRLLDVPEHQISELENTRSLKKSLHIHSPVAGTVINIGSRQGQHVTPNSELYMLVDLDQVWVYADVFEYEIPWVSVGDTVNMTLTSVPGKIFEGSVAYIYPYAEIKTRTTKVRMVFDNPKLLLRPDMFAQISIHVDTLENTVVIPSEAVIRSGERTQVFVQRDTGKFEPRIVKLGIESGGKVAVLNGVVAGERVVTSAQFMVDSESKLREATAKMMEAINTSSSGGDEGTHSSSKKKRSNVTGLSGVNTDSVSAPPAMDHASGIGESEHDHD